MSAEEVKAFRAEGESAPVVVLCGESQPDGWSDRVAREFSPLPVLFAWPDQAGWAVKKTDEGISANPHQQELELVAAVLEREGNLGVGNRVRFHYDTVGASPSSVGFEVAAPAYAPGGLVERVATSAGIDEWINQQNAETIPQIVQTLRSAMGVIPFLGAGMSAAFGYPVWGQFFVQLAASAATGACGLARALSSVEHEKVIRLANVQQFEKAADVLVNWDKERFYAEVESQFGKPPTLGVATPLSRLPLLAAGPIITTNFDPVIEHIYAGLGRPFPNDRRIVGARKYPEMVVTALQQNWSALIKLHGDARIADSLIFTELEYKESYGDLVENPGPVERLASVIYTNRPLLFLGCSLETDRTITSLENVYRRNHFVGHYAILDAPYRLSVRDRKSARLRGAGIRPLWFQPGMFKQIDVLLDRLVSLIAQDEITPEPSSPAITLPDLTIHSELPLPRKASRRVGIWPCRRGRWPELTDDHIRTVVDDLVAGRLVFFLGAAVHPVRMQGYEFYAEICRQAQIAWPRRDRTDAAQYVADLDRNRLASIISETIRKNYTRAGRAHYFVVSLSEKLRELESPPPMILTTNYDSVLEATFDAAHEPYHLFIYNHFGPYAGRFLHRHPDGREFAIRSPAAIREPLIAPAIVKLNGGVDPRNHWPESFVVASSDFEELSTRLPAVLPQVIWDALTQRSMLFLGHGLREPDVRSLLRRRRSEDAPRSWAVQIDKDKDDAAYWSVARLQVVEADLNVYVERFDSALDKVHP